MVPLTLALRLVGTATSYKLYGPRFEYRQGQNILSFPQPSMANLRPTQPRIQLVPELVKRPGRDVDHSPLSNTKVKNEWSYTSFYPAYLHGVDKDGFIFNFTVKEGWYVQVHASHSTGRYILFSCLFEAVWLL